MAIFFCMLTILIVYLLIRLINRKIEYKTPWLLDDEVILYKEPLEDKASLPIKWFVTNKRVILSRNYIGTNFDSVYLKNIHTIEYFKLQLTINGVIKHFASVELLKRIGSAKNKENT